MPYRLYENHEQFLKLDTLEQVERIQDKKTRLRLKHAFIDHYLQHALLPHETEMQTWMRGAVALVNDERVYFKNIIQWCQTSSTHSDRVILQKETGPLCKFFKPFALNYWEILLELLEHELGYNTYIDYCAEKKGVDYGKFIGFLEDVLTKTEKIYFKAMQTWTESRFGLPLTDLNRFDAINLLGMREFNDMLPEDAVEHSVTFLNNWHIHLAEIEGLHLDIQYDERKSDQAMSFLLQIPNEIHVVMNPVGGWIDLETLWHELGHGLSAVFVSPSLSITERELATSYSLSESYAFLLQNITLSKPFLKHFLKLDKATAHRLYRYKILKDLAVFRRYAAKFVSEYRMFKRNDLTDGQPYAELMTRHTGFYHQPESHLFDLVPEFYCLDYLLAWMGEAAMEAHLKKCYGPEWMFQPAAGDTLKRWWRQGNRLDIFEFFKKNDLGSLTADLLMNRWNTTLRH